MAADVAQPGGPQQRIGQGMQKGVRIGMAQQSLAVGNFDPAEDQLATLRQTMDVVTLPDSDFHRLPRKIPSAMARSAG